jgi:enoyl-CoA hydratase/carnithine racemase
MLRMAARQIESQVAPKVERRIDGSVAILTMRHPPYNLLNAALSELIADGLRWAAAEGARAVVLRSALRHFSAGADLDAMHFGDDDGEPERLPARRGEHNEEVLAELGYDAAEIDSLRRRGVLVCDG